MQSSGRYQSPLRQARLFARLMDSQFSLAGIRFGWENVIGLIPGVGDFLTFAFSFYLVWVGVQMRLPRHALNQMIANIVLDGLIGTIPLLGDVGDVFFKANLRNLKLLEQYDDMPILDGEILPDSKE